MMPGDGEPRITGTGSFDKSTQLYRIDITLRDLLNHSRIRGYLAEMITRVVKTALMEKYGEIQQIVDEVLLSEKTKELVKSAIRIEIEKATAQAVKEMFDGK